MFKVIESRVPISKVVAQQIEEAILSKKFMPGSKLPSELELCKLFGVSRTAVREAMQALAAMNYVSIQKGKGIYVNEMTSDSFIEPLKKYLQLNLNKSYVRDLMSARLIFEPVIVRLAAKKRTDEDIDILIDDMANLKNSKGDFQELATLDMKFHSDIAAATHNQILPSVLEPVIGSYLPVIEIKSYVYETIATAKESAYISHKEILDRIIERDEEGAFLAMQRHLQTAEEHTEIMLAERFPDEE